VSVSLLSGGMPGLIAPALVAGLLVASTHVPLGREVLKRGIIFLDLAVAQIAGLGAVAATAYGLSGVGQQIAAFVCSLGAAFMFSHMEKKAQVIQEAFIGCAFVLAASLAILVFASDPHAGEEVSNLMAGQILWVQWGHIGLVALVYAPILFVLLRLPEQGRKYFYLLFAACITVSVQMIGVYLVFASLILPALASTRLIGAHGLAVGYMTAFIAVCGGLVLSVITDLPSGPVVVCGYVIAAGPCRLLQTAIAGKASAEEV
jgi:zinc/manganese transport system permease protein